MQEVPRHSPRRLSLCCRWERNNDACGCLRWAALSPPALSRSSASLFRRPASPLISTEQLGLWDGGGGGGGCFTSSSLIKGIRHNKRERQPDERLNPVRREGRTKKNFINIAPTFINSHGGHALFLLLLSVVTRACLLRVTWCKCYFKVIIFSNNIFGA